ncbi:MAG TPA: diguanylate cyclase [Candidatus Nitrosotenuis sp.]|jgi:dihydroorotate dehydrogenase|nr:diguanylate cyclase [Candidatus Nitrosotenuis sp.]
MTQQNSNWLVKADLHGQTCRVKSILISPPFGNYIKTPFTTSVKGSFTWQRRPGLVRQVVKTLRQIPGGYVNRIGLRNRGIREVSFCERHIYSIVGMTTDEWDFLIDFLPHFLKLEINVGCPNSWQNCITNDHVRRFAHKYQHITFKLSPSHVMEDLGRFVDLGIRRFHLCNTLPTSRGGESGLRLKQMTLPLIEKARHTYPHIHLVGGGGIYTLQDAMDYYHAGVQSFSLATVWFNPIRAFRLTQQLHNFLNHLPNQEVRYDF